MRRYRKCSSNKKSCGCNNNGYNNNGYNNNVNNALDQCNQYKQAAQQKCEQAENLNCKANKIAQQAVAAEQQAQALNQQAKQQCQSANDLWDQYNQLAKQGMCLMQQAQDCLAKSAQCYANLYEEQEGCNLSDYGTNVANNTNATNNTNNNTTTHQTQPYVSWEVLNAWQKSMGHKHDYHGHGCNCGCNCGCNDCGCH